LKDSSANMTDFAAVHFWKALPNRDEVLEVAYNFLKELSEKHPEKAASIIMVKDMEKFLASLDDSMKQFLSLAIEDVDWDDLSGKDLSMEIDNPYTMDEDLIRPEFSGNQFVLGKNESFSLFLGLKGYITSIRVHFILVEEDELFYLRLHRLTAK
jgi:hypothetical protein